MAAPTLKPMSAEEYLHTEELSSFKREYVNGFVYPLHGATRAEAGTSKTHMRIGLNFARAFDTAALQNGCRLHLADMKLRIEESNVFYYPDVMVVCGPDNGQEYYETAPCLLVEVLSKRTAAVDRHAKYHAYTALPSLQMYLIAAQDERRVYAYTREGTSWQLGEYAAQSVIPVPCLNLSLSLDDLYAGVSV
ncbi:Uma2 family endonuclease [Deinococcus sp.]|uniref:Uma2 family endonuclease n=1 Tax=Deinococcus sp. TaxID=47478 RepID=UPI003CC520FA